MSLCSALAVTIFALTMSSSECIIFQEVFILEEQFTEYICPKCKTKENIPTHIVMNFDFLDDGDSLVPPRFGCEKCDGDMVPIYFVGHTGIVYQYND